MTKVIFEYNEASEKWSAVVEGVANEEEAREAFSAVVLTVGMLPTDLLTRTIVRQDGERYAITPVI